MRPELAVLFTLAALVVVVFLWTDNDSKTKGIKMLCLSRKGGTSIVLPDLNITINILEVRGQYAHIGIEAPRKIQIVRGELLTLTPAEIEARANRIVNPVGGVSGSQEADTHEA